MNMNQGQNPEKNPAGNFDLPMAGRFVRKIFPVLLLSALLPAWTSTAWTSGQEAGQDNRVLRATLHNGLRVVIVPNPLAPVASIVVNYRVGSNEAPDDFPGTAHAQEHMMFRGSPGLSGKQLANVTAAIGGSFNADTQQTVTQYFFAVPVEDLDIALHIESLRMRGILADEKSWGQERGAIEQEIAQDLSSPEYVGYTKLLATLFKGTPYAHTPLGTRSSFDQTSAAMLKQFHDTWYVPNNAVLVVVGDVQPQDTLARIQRLFEDIPAGKISPAVDVHLQPVKPETFDLETDEPYGLVMIAFRLPGSNSPDFAAVQVLADVLNSERGNLYGLVTEGKALSAGFSTNTFPETAAGYAVASFPKGVDADALIEAVFKILAADAQNGYPPDLVESAKRQEITAAELGKTSMLGLATAWSQAVAVEGRRSP